MLILTALFISATVFGTLLSSAPVGASWTIGAHTGVNNFRRIVGCTGFLTSIILLMFTICVL